MENWALISSHLNGNTDKGVALTVLENENLYLRTSLGRHSDILHRDQHEELLSIFLQSCFVTLFQRSILLLISLHRLLISANCIFSDVDLNLSRGLLFC